MKIKIIGKELKITEAINDYVEKKLDRIDKYFEDAEADVTLKTEKNEQTAEICIIANGEKYRAVTEDKDMYASIDKDIDILEGQIRKAKTKKEPENKEKTDKEKINNIIKEAKENGKMTYSDLATKLNEVNPEKMDEVFDEFEKGGIDLLPDDFDEEPNIEDLKEVEELKQLLNK